MKDVKINKLQKKATEAIALAAVESSHHREAKEVIESTNHKVSTICVSGIAQIIELN